MLNLSYFPCSLKCNVLNQVKNSKTRASENVRSDELFLCQFNSDEQKTSNFALIGQNLHSSCCPYLFSHLPNDMGISVCPYLNRKKLYLHVWKMDA